MTSALAQCYKAFVEKVTLINTQRFPFVMKFAFSLIGLVAVVTLLAGCLDGNGGGAAVKDCGDDMQCFVEATETCTPAKVIMPGPSEGATMHTEIKGGTPEQCSIYYGIEGGDLDGKSMTCTFDMTDTTNMYDCEEITSICSGSWVQDICGES